MVGYDPASRVARARQLAERYPAAADLLAFYAKLAEYQSSLIEGARVIRGDEPPLLLVDPFLAWLSREAPAALARAALELRQRGSEYWRDQFARAFTDGGHELSDDALPMFVVEAILQPRAEYAARTSDSPGTGDRSEVPACCPLCSCAPVAGVLREVGHGARRALVCARCGHEWRYDRVFCPACGEHEFGALPVYTADPFQHVRVEACDCCHRYLKTIDLTRDGQAIPQVDDVASLPLDLWAREHGYVRIRANLLRI
jgi:FdhE protein